MICWHALQSGRSLEEKQSLFDELKFEWNMHCTDDSVVCLNYINVHMCRHIDRFHGVPEEYGVGHRNLE